MRIYSRESFRDMPWKNGGGTTTKLYRFPAEGDFRLRISMARIEKDGPFSAFPGIDRTLIILEGAGCDLDSGEKKVKLTKDSPAYEFPGEEPYVCRLLGGTVIDFNVMIDRTAGRVKVRRHCGGKLKAGILPAFHFDPKELLLREFGAEDYELPEGILVEVYFNL